MFQLGQFILHSGQHSRFLVDCKTLVKSDWQALAWIVSQHLKFSAVVGVPTGGLQFAEACREYANPTKLLPVLIADDVFTTGASMEGMRCRTSQPVIGCVVFARSPCPSWIFSIFHMVAL